MYFPGDGVQKRPDLGLKLGKYVHQLWYLIEPTCHVELNSIHSTFLRDSDSPYPAMSSSNLPPPKVPEHAVGGFNLVVKLLLIFHGGLYEGYLEWLFIAAGKSPII